MNSRTLTKSAIATAFPNSNSKLQSDSPEKYKRFEITEVWFWENNPLTLYRFRGEDYEQISTSELFPDLEIELLVRCVQMPSRLQARTEFLQGIYSE